MNRAVPLSQFMPYGAPDLIAAGRTHMSRAVMTSSLLAVAAFLLAVALAPLVPERVEQAVPVPPIHDFVNPPLLPPPDQPPSVEPVAPRSSGDQGILQPVPDVEVHPAEQPPAPPRSGTPDGQVDAPVVPIMPVLPPEPEGLPGRDVIYADELPVPITRVTPDYPYIAQQAGVEGYVVVHALVGKDGRVVKCELDKKASVPMLNNAALEAARKWVFKPALTNNRPVAVWVALPIRFNLH